MVAFPCPFNMQFSNPSFRKVLETNAVFLNNSSFLFLMSFTSPHHSITSSSVGLFNGVGDLNINSIPRQYTPITPCLAAKSNKSIQSICPLDRFINLFVTLGSSWRQIFSNSKYVCALIDILQVIILSNS